MTAGEDRHLTPRSDEISSQPPPPPPPVFSDPVIYRGKPRSPPLPSSPIMHHFGSDLPESTRRGNYQKSAVLLRRGRMRRRCWRRRMNQSIIRQQDLFFFYDKVRHVSTVGFLFRAQTQHHNLNMKTSTDLHLQECAAAGHIDHPAKTV